MAIQIGDTIPIFDQQIKGQWITESGQRFPHVLPSGMYHVRQLFCNREIVHLESKCGHVYECGAYSIGAVLQPNIEAVAAGAVP